MEPQVCKVHQEQREHKDCQDNRDPQETFSLMASAY